MHGNYCVVGAECCGYAHGTVYRSYKGSESNLHYPRQRDIHYAGIVFLQMLLGLNVTERYPDVQSALQSCMSVCW